MLTVQLEVARDLGVAALAGLAVGIEREWSGHATGPGARFAGARTFLLLGLLGGLAGWFTGGGLAALGGLTLAGGVTLTVAAYVMAARRGGPEVEGTTEVAALVVLGLGTVAGLGFPLLTSAAVSVMILALVEKTRIHQLIARIGERELAAALQFAVLALVILPLLPTGPYGPFGSIRPRTVWLVVLLLSGLNFAGHLARRAVGGTRGYGLTGLLGGVISSTAVTLGFSRLSRETPALGRALAGGVAGACTVLLLKILFLAAILNITLVGPLVPYLVPPLVVGLGLSAAMLLREPVAGRTTAAEARSPLGLWSSVRMALAFQGVLVLIPLVQSAWGDVGVLTSAALVGITDMDALTLSMARLGASPESLALAARAIAVGLLASTLFRLSLVLIVGSGAFRRRAALAVAALAGATGLGIWIATGAAP